MLDGTDEDARDGTDEDAGTEKSVDTSIDVKEWLKKVASFEKKKWSEELDVAAKAAATNMLQGQQSLMLQRKRRRITTISSRRGGRLGKSLLATYLISLKLKSVKQLASCFLQEIEKGQ